MLVLWFQDHWIFLTITSKVCSLSLLPRDIYLFMSFEILTFEPTFILWRFKLDFLRLVILHSSPVFVFATPSSQWLTFTFLSLANLLMIRIPFSQPLSYRVQISSPSLLFVSSNYQLLNLLLQYLGLGSLILSFDCWFLSFWLLYSRLSFHF